MSTGLTDWEKHEQRETQTQQKEARGPPSPLFTIKEAVNYLRLSQSTLYTRLHEFDTVRLGGRIYLTRASCDRYIASNTRKASIPPKRSRRKAPQHLDDAA